MKITRLFLAIAVLLVPVLVFSNSKGDNEESKFRWDLITFDPSTNTILPGGVNSSAASDGSMITLTGTGTFVVPRSGKPSSAATGGGTWTTTDSSGKQTGSGNYTVRELVRFDGRPGTLSGVNDGIGEIEDARAGLVFLTVAFDDGAHGVLVVSCNLAGAATDFEGITASKGPVDYWNTQPPPVGTLFHVIGGEN